MRVFGSKSVPRLHEVGIDWRVLLFTLAVSIGAGVLFGLVPGTVWYSSLVSPEAVFHLVLMSALLLLSIAAGGRRQSVLIGAAGAMLGLLFVTRPVGLFFYIAFLAYILTSEAFRAWRERAFTYGLSLAAGSFLLPVVLLGLANYSIFGEFKVSSHSTGTWNLLNGTNFETQGMYSDGDAELAGYTGANATSWKEADRKAMQIAISRIKADPLRFVRFALSDKIAAMWGHDIQGLY